MQDLVFHAATSDFQQLLQVLDTCDYLQLCDWQFSSHFNLALITLDFLFLIRLASELCSEAGVTRATPLPRRQRNGSNFIALPARVIKMCFMFCAARQL